ncbi:hypothetical protein AAVH_27822 [Aphelenchoides avenae]|nr:hypothetical protein AAVH_27822 [Aphelenchus avenae]
MNVTSPVDFTTCISFERNLEYFVVLLYAVPSLAIYLLVIIVLFRRLEAPFYRIFALGGLLDTVGWIVHFACNRAIFFPSAFYIFASLPKEGFFPSMIYFTSYYFTFAPYASTFFLTLNRFISAFSLRGARQEWIVPVAYAVILVFPVTVTWYIWWSEVKLRPLDANDPCTGFYFGDSVKPWGLRKSMFLSVVSLAQGTVVVAMNLAIASKLFVRRNHLSMSAAQVADTRDTEIKLFCLTLIVFVYNISTCVCQVFWYVGGNLVSNELTFILLNVQTFGEDVHVCTAPWFLIFMSSAVRAELRKAYGIVFWQHKAGDVQIVHVSSPKNTA